VQVIKSRFFQTFSADQIPRLESIELSTHANHQGWITDPSQGVWSWFELVVLDNAMDTAPRTLPDGQPMVLLSHILPEGAQLATQQAKRFTVQDEILSWVQPGNLIGVRVCARFPRWSNIAREGSLTVNFTGALGERNQCSPEPDSVAGHDVVRQG
jgi:hypothetical protein